MKYIPMMWLAMRNYVKILILLIIIFQVFVVIVTFEESGHREHVPKYGVIEKSNVTVGSLSNKNNSGLQTSTSRIKHSGGIFDKIRQLSHFDNLNNSPYTAYTSNNSFESSDHLLQNVQLKHDNPMFTDTTAKSIRPQSSTKYVSLPKNSLSHILKNFFPISNHMEESAVGATGYVDTTEIITFNPINNDIKSKFSTSKSIWETTKDTSENEEPQIFQGIFSDLDKYYNRITTEYSVYSSHQPIYQEENNMETKRSTVAPAEDNFAINVDHEVKESFEKSKVPPITQNMKPIHKTKQHSLLKDILKLFHKKRQEPEIASTSTERIQTTSEYDGLFRSSSEYDTVAMIRGAGYPVESYRVQTEDGYILNVYRIPPTVPAGRPSRRRWMPVYLQHGLWSSSYHWFETKPQYSLPLILSDAGYDVWIGNSRGNVVSQEHVYLSTATNSSFWDFSFHEMGVYDLPATIELVLNVSGKPQIHYIGHSMGTTMFFVMASLRPDIASKVHFMLALAPIATVGPIRNFFRLMLLFERFILTREKPVVFLTQNGISLKTVLHYMQLYVTGKFAMYDYGKIANMDIYKSAVPPAYDLTRIEIPIVLCYGTNDPFVRTEDLITLASSLGNALGMWPVPLTHFQLTGGKETQEYLYQYIPLHLH